MKKRSLAIAVVLLIAAVGCSSHKQLSQQQTAPPPASVGPTAAVASASDGAKIFDTNCSSCHGANGQGIAGAIPPLAKNPTVVGDATKVIHIVKYGLTGAISVNGHPFNGQMPAWGATLSNADVAAVLTYVRSSWGNKAPGVSEAQVAAVSK